MNRKISAERTNSGEALVALLLPISKLMLRNGLGTADLIKAAKHACVRAAIAQVVLPGERINVSRLSVVTGLTRKEVSVIVEELRRGRDADQAEVKEQRVMRVLRGWATDPRFGDRYGKPAKLPIRGERKSFAALVRQYGGDVTPNSVLRELERMNLVTATKSGELRLRSLHSKLKEPESMLELARLFPDFADTVSGQSGIDLRQPFFGYRESIVDSPDQAARFQRTFAERAAAVLQSVEQWVASQARSRRVKSKPRPDGRRVGIGVYLVQSPAESSPSSRRVRDILQ